MKAYLFNSESGLYEGEIFVEDAKLQSEGGITPLPPPAYESGQAPVFDRDKKEWVVIPTTIARQLLYGSQANSMESNS